MRVVLALGAALVVMAVMTLILGMRNDMGTVAIAPYLVAMGGLALIALASFSVSLRGAHQRPLGGLAWGVVGLALLVPIELALNPDFWSRAPVAADSIGTMCLALGIVTGALASMPVFLMQRASVPVMARAAAALAGGGVVAFAMLQLHCPSHDVSHLVFGHAAVGALLVAGSVLIVWMRRR
jgi:hypothetical protein